MPSPFPGMDPWLEDPDVFPDLHNTFIAYLRETITKALPAGYYSSICNRVYMEGAESHREPDINIHDSESGKSDSGGVAVAVVFKTQPILILPSSDPIDEWFMEIRNRNGKRLVTAVEILSPSNKRSASKGREEYLKKQEEYRQDGANLVEIDLLRDGLHTTAVNRPVLVRQAGAFDYHACVTRRAPGRRTEVYPILLGERLPTINIPLLPEHSDIHADMQAVFERCYESAGYERRVVYADLSALALNPRQRKIVQHYIPDLK